MQIHLGGCDLYDLDRQRAFRARYMTKNPLESQEHEKYDEKNVEYRGNIATK